MGETGVKFSAKSSENSHHAPQFGDRQARGLWSQLLPYLPGFFNGLDLEPALLHGDLWEGNAGQLRSGPVIYDPACFYGHAEFDLSMSTLFGGIDSSFYESYFKVLPKQPGYESRLQLYFLYHNINHWNHFGGDYVSASLSLLKRLIHDRKKQ